MMFETKRPKITRQEGLAAKPIRLVEAEISPTPDGGGRIKVPLKPARWATWLLRVPAGTTKTFEFDPMSLFVWECCDGKTSVQQIIRRLAKRYNLNLREAEVPTIRFLQTLIKKGLVGMPMKSRT